ncbi:hypothetical protein HDU88_000424 [Geranomyces variabilis]|nr:hypothetical protein HDU88_000424 [Geranomyces variabilis]
MSAEDAEALLAAIEARQTETTLPAAAPPTPAGPEDNPDDELDQASQLYYASLLADFQTQHPDAVPPSPTTLLAQEKDRLFEEFLVLRAREKRKELSPTPERPLKRQALADISLAPKFPGFPTDADTTAAPAAETKTVLELQDLEISAASHFGIRPITAGSSHAVVSTHPDIQCALNRRADNIA